jgi:hypothetical protein
MMQLIDTRLQEAADEMGSCDIEIGEVGAIRFMEVVIAFVKRRVGSSYYRGEKCRRGDLDGYVWEREETMLEHGAEDSELWLSAW